jgi:hypothetical protein
MSAVENQNKIEGLVEYLQWCATHVGKVAKQRFNGYSCFEDFVLKNGMEFTKKGRLPKGERKGIQKQCYANSTRLVMRHPNLTYVEGYAAGIIPVMHAWCVTKDGKVIDPTWKDSSKCNYFGVPFKRKYLTHSIIEHGVYGLIDLWQQGWPTLKASTDEFLEKGITP